MFFRLVVLLCLSWPYVIGEETLNVQDQTLDQVATASENVVQNAEALKKERDIRDQLITSMIDTTVHYENSNGFVPMVSSSSPEPDLQEHTEASNITWTNSLNEKDNSTSSEDDDDDDDDDDEEGEEEQEVDEIENDPAYSTEARIFLNFPSLSTNRRSFEYQGNHNDFELLKVTNDTPVVANYPDAYGEPPSSMENENQQTEAPSRHTVKGKGKKMEDYTGNYGMVQTQQNNHDDFYDHYYNSAKEKANREPEKVASNYHQNVMSYDSPGVGSTATTLTRTNEQVNEPVRNYDNVDSSSQMTKNHRFARPVVVAETNYNIDQSSGIVDDYQTSRIIESSSSEDSNRFTMKDRDGRFRSDEDSRDVSDDTDYVEYTERPKRVQKARRRPSSNDNSKRLPKEHRGSTDNSAEYENQGKRHHSSRTKSHRQRVRGNSWDDDGHRDQDDSYEDTRYDGRLSGSETRPSKSHQSKFKPSNSWNQISPNLEISHSSGVEIGQLEKPKLIVPFKVNLVPLANFDHATAIGNSQGFDMSNAVLQNIVSATPVNTATPIMSTSESVDTKFRVSTPVPNIVVGQNSFQNSMQALFPQFNDQNKFSTNLKPQYVSSTVSPVYAVTPALDSNLQDIQDVQGTATPRPTYFNSHNHVQQLSSNQLQQLIVPQPTLQTVPTIMQTPVQTNSDSFNVQVNPHGMQGQNLINHSNFQGQNIPTVSTVTPTPQPIPVTKINLITAESQNKKTLIPGSSANFLATASLSVGQGDQRPSLNGNSYYLQPSGSQQVVKQPGMYQQVFKNVNVAPKTKTYIQTTHLVPAMFHPMPTITAFTGSTSQLMPDHQNIQGSSFLLQQPRDQGQQFVKIPATGTDQSLKSFKMPSLMYQSIDNVGSHSTNNMNALSGVPGIVENAHLPYVGTRNVEIVNPNIKPSQVDTIVNSYETMHYPAAVFTTPIPMFTTTSFLATRPVLSSTTETTNVQNFVNSLTEIGAKGNQASLGDLKAYQSQEKPMFNPINFVPNVDVMKNQNALNSKLHASEPLQQNLNLVPLLPGGNFFKPSFSAQSELLVKPKLNSDLENYAEQMFKESLKTIYNSHKWNNDRKNTRQNVSMSDSTDITKLRNELQKLKASLSDNKKNKDHEAHHSETKVQTTELPSKKPDELLAALEQMLKTHPDPVHYYYGNNRPHRNRRPSEQDKYNFPSSDFRDTKHVREFMTPPQAGPHRSKGHYHDTPSKKRPGHGPSRFNSHHHGPRSHPRHNMSHKSGGLETSSTNVDPVHLDSPQFENYHDLNYHGHSDFRKGSYPSFSASLPDKNNFLKGPKYQKALNGKDGSMNHPRMHNLLGLMMKNKQLPSGGQPNYFRDKDQLRQFFDDEKHRMQQQLYDDTLKDYFYKMSDGMLYSNSGPTGSDGRRSVREKGSG